MRGTYTGRSDVANRRIPCDPWLLPDDGITDAIAVEIAVKGIRPVRMTAGERALAARGIITKGGDVRKIMNHLMLPSMRDARALARHVRKESR